MCTGFDTIQSIRAWMMRSPGATVHLAELFTHTFAREVPSTSTTTRLSNPMWPNARSMTILAAGLATFIGSRSQASVSLLAQIDASRSFVS